MTALYPIRRACPVCGKPMKVVPENQPGRERYVCTDCEDDPLHDPASSVSVGVASAPSLTPEWLTLPETMISRL